MTEPCGELWSWKEKYQELEKYSKKLREELLEAKKELSKAQAALGMTVEQMMASVQHKDALKEENENLRRQVPGRSQAYADLDERAR